MTQQYTYITVSRQQAHKKYIQELKKLSKLEEQRKKIFYFSIASIVTIACYQLRPDREPNQHNNISGIYLASLLYNAYINNKRLIKTQEKLKEAGHNIWAQKPQPDSIHHDSNR